MKETELDAVETAQGDAIRTDFDEYASYEEDDSLVVCDRTDPNAWVKSDVTMGVEE